MRTMVKRIARMVLRPFKSLARPLVRRFDNHLAHVMRTVLHNEPGSNVPTFWHLISVRDDIVTRIEAAKGAGNSIVQNVTAQNSEEMDLLVDSLVREIVRLQHQVDGIRAQLVGLTADRPDVQVTTRPEGISKAA